MLSLNYPAYSSCTRGWHVRRLAPTNTLCNYFIELQINIMRVTLLLLLMLLLLMLLLLMLLQLMLLLLCLYCWDSWSNVRRSSILLYWKLKFLGRSHSFDDVPATRSATFRQRSIHYSSSDVAVIIVVAIIWSWVHHRRRGLSRAKSRAWCWRSTPNK